VNKATHNKTAPWCPRLDCWLHEAWQEAGLAGDPGEYLKDYAILPKRLFDLVGSLPQKKNTISALSALLASVPPWLKRDSRCWSLSGEGSDLVRFCNLPTALLDVTTCPSAISITL